LSLFQNGDEVDYGDDNMDGNSGSGSYRVYVGMALAILIFGLAYMAWRSTQASQGSHLARLAPAIVPTEPSSPAPASATNTDTPTESPAASGAASASPPSAASPVSNEDSAKSAPDKATEDETRAAKRPKSDALARAGSEEFATAQSYLDGANAHGRNSAEAAKWLWKAVAKHNADATLLLADLYLKGDGVSKNCDQARVLLDAAARKGMKNAGERLRHLAAFGCQ
jgi:hypothetical protein